MLKSNKSKLRWVGVIVLGIMFIGLQGFVVDDVRAEQSQMDVLVDLFGNEFVSADAVAAAVEQGLVGDVSAGPNDEDLVFTPVKPCRIYDSRKTCSSCGVFNPGNCRELYVWGTSDIANQGGNAAGCSSPQGEPAAVHLNVTAVPQSGIGWFTVFPANVSAPLASLVNYDGAVQNIANAATIKCYFQAGAREIEVSNGGNGISHLVIDVMGYYYAAP
jgi:hypothetical protein